MVIRFICNKVYDGWSPTDKRLGGTEESIVEWARHLVQKGHHVVVYLNQRSGLQPNMDKGVYYRPRGSYYEEAGDGFTINVKSPEINSKEPSVYLTNETDAKRHNLSKFKAVILPSQWAVDNLGIKHENIEILPHGYNDKEIYPGKKIPNQCLYASSPDRGLERVLEAWKSVPLHLPNAQLVITYGIKDIVLPNVTCLGDTDEKTMNELYQTSDLWLHPANGGELYCMTGIKAQAAGCIPVIIPTMALKETVRHGVFSNEEKYTKDLLAIMKDPKRKTEIRKALVKETYPTWEASTERLLEILSKYG